MEITVKSGILGCSVGVVRKFIFYSSVRFALSEMEDVEVHQFLQACDFFWFFFVGGGGLASSNFGNKFTYIFWKFMTDLSYVTVTPSPEIKAGYFYETSKKKSYSV
jgi:hypothetical protein